MATLPQMKSFLTRASKKSDASDGLKRIANALKNFRQLDKGDQKDLNDLVRSAYAKLKSKPKAKATPTPRKATPKKTDSFSTDLAKFKKKVGKVIYRRATSNTDIIKDAQRPALKSGKRIVRKAGYTSNQYGTFPNQVGTPYWESRSNRMDVNQPSQRARIKLADGGQTSKIVRDGSYLFGYEPYFEKNVMIASIDDIEKVVRPTHGYYPNHPLSKKAIAWAKKNGYQYIADGKKYAKGGNLNRLSNSRLDEIIKRHEVVTEQVRFAFAKVLGLDKAYELLMRDSSSISPYGLVEKAVYSDLLLIDEIDENLINSAIEYSEDSHSQEEIGSSDMTYILKYMLDGAGLKTDFVNGTLQRVDNNGNVIQLKNELPKTTMFAKGGKITEHSKIDLVVKKPWGDEKIEVAKFKGRGDALISARALNENSPTNFSYSVNNLKKYAKGGKLSSRAKYIPNRDIEEVEVNQNGKTRFIDGADIVDGFYVKKKGKFAKGGEIGESYVFGNEGYSYTNSFGVDQSDFIKLVDVYHNTNPSEQMDRIVERLTYREFAHKYGDEKLHLVMNYIHQTHKSHEGKYGNGGNLDEAKVYVADLMEYNNGRLVGKWFNLSDYSSGAELMEAIQEMLDEQTKKDKYGDVHEEWAVHDFEGFPRSFYSEYMGESDFDNIYEIMKVADSSNLPVDVLMEAMSDLGYEDNAERVAEAYYSSVPASMGNEFRDFAYEYIDSIGSITDAVSNPEYYFDYESFGSDARMDYTDEELEEYGYDELDDTELGERLVDEMGGFDQLGQKNIEMYFDYDKFGRDLEYDFIAVRGKDGDYYFFNRNFAKGGNFEISIEEKKKSLRGNPTLKL